MLADLWSRDIEENYEENLSYYLLFGVDRCHDAPNHNANNDMHENLETYLSEYRRVPGRYANMLRGSESW
jgi:hypothetical protein